MEPLSPIHANRPFRRLAWVTDPHFNDAPLHAWDRFVAEILEAQVEGIFITGDISESADLDWHLKRLADAIGLPIWFVLGNHDFYHSSIASVRALASELSRHHPLLHYLTGSSSICLEGSTSNQLRWSICGEDGWADARVGDFYRSPVRMMDYEFIHDFIGTTAEDRLKKIQREGLASALRLRQQLEQTRLAARNQIVLTHIPPFREACWYDGQHSDDAWAPYFTCTAVGWMLKRFCRRFPEQRVLVFCGHTHSSGVSQLSHNLSVWTGASSYGQPQINAILDLDTFPVAEYDWTFSGGFKSQSAPAFSDATNSDRKGRA